ncbi:unnamed protein product [Jaminaea pallidilutea]
MPPKTKNKDSVEALLSDLDNLGTEEASMPSANRPPAQSDARKAPPSGAAAKDDAQSLLDDLDSLVQRRAPTPKRSGTPSGGTSAGANAGASGLKSQAPARPSSTDPTGAGAADTTQLPSSSVAGESPAVVAAQALETIPAPEQQQNDRGVPGAASTAAPISDPDVSAAATPLAGASGWGGWWSSATKLADQARAEIEKRAQSEQAKELSQRGWGLAQNVRGFVKETGWEKLGEDLTKVGKRGWTEVINAVAPPIAAHEVIQVTLSHDMVGFDGVPDVTFRVLTRVMEAQMARGRDVEQQLIVNSAPSEIPSQEQSEREDGVRDMKAVDGFEAAWRLAEANLSKLIAVHEPEAPKESNVSVPVAHCPVFVRIQPVIAPLPGQAGPSGSGSGSGSGSATPTPREAKQVYFLILLQDPSHGLSHKTCSQAMPHEWLSLPFDENTWIEQSMVDVLEGSLSIVGQDYVNGRQSGRTRSIDKAAV